jgi:hypothetical protein
VSIDQWEHAMEGTLSAWISKGYYVIPLDAEGLRRDEPLVFRRSAHTRPVEMRRSQVDQYVSIITIEPPTYAVMSVEDSPFNILNDAAYVAGCSEAEYIAQLHRNHAEFVIGIGPDGTHDELFMRFHQGAESGMEVFATYGWQYWSATVGAPGGASTSAADVVVGRPDRRSYDTAIGLDGNAYPLGGTAVEPTQQGCQISEPPRPVRRVISYPGCRPPHLRCYPDGVRPCGPHRYQARYRDLYLGSFDTVVAAERACMQARDRDAARLAAAREAVVERPGIWAHIAAADAEHTRLLVAGMLPTISTNGVVLHLSPTAASGYCGVTKMATGTGGSLVKRWRSKLGHNKISYHDTAAGAAEAYALA